MFHPPCATRTIFLLKHIAGIHIRNNKDGFILSPTQLETIWLTQARNRPNININLCHHFLNKLLVYHINNLSQITLPNGTHLMITKTLPHITLNPQRLKKCAKTSYPTLLSTQSHVQISSPPTPFFLNLSSSIITLTCHNPLSNLQYLSKKDHLLHSQLYGSNLNIPLIFMYMDIQQ